MAEVGFGNFFTLITVEKQKDKNKIEQANYKSETTKIPTRISRMEEF